MSFRGVHSSSPASMRTIPSASTRKHFDSFELLRGAAPKPQFSPPSIRSLLVQLTNSENLERGEEKLEGEERDMLDQSTSTGIRASKTPICDHEISEQVRDDRAPRDRWGAPARRLCRGNCAEAVCVKMNCVKMNCAKRLYRDSRIKYDMGCKPLRTAQTPPVSRAGFDTGCKPSRATRPSPAQPGHALPYRSSIKSGPYSRHPTGQCPNIQRAGVKNRTVIARIDSTADSGHKKTPDS